ncbi:hypothetical protein K488DRAFT_84239 [Vararia minispora EC-137]|uniref:Uncharacterized protein n=1 Tax=Vararia minispora EC-137 TaxID=1314806 RepID=A0ACB8QRF9_9AGAM|nr:hypothetical protein K488DRAFT_84239 [Vararia minispora EC-137]
MTPVRYEIPPGLDFGTIPRPNPVRTPAATNTDIVNATRFRDDVWHQYQIPSHDRPTRPLSKEAVAEAIRYEHRLIHTTLPSPATDANARPAWVDGLVAEINRNTDALSTLGEKIDVLSMKVDTLDKRVGTLEKKMGMVEKRAGALERKVGVLEEKIDTLDEKVEPLHRTGMISYRLVARRENSLQDNASALLEVPFLNGELPTSKRHSGRRRPFLPELTSVAQIKALSAADSIAYFRGYFPESDVPANMQDRLQGIFIAVGCTYSLDSL